METRFYELFLYFCQCRDKTNDNENRENKASFNACNLFIGYACCGNKPRW